MRNLSLSPAIRTVRRDPGAGRGLIGRLRDMFALRAQRRRLAALDAAQLRDLGLTRAQAAAEAARPVWDVPAHWRG
ncbi:MAG: DUF1127 domain-containing protein [Rhodobacterales bacterium]|nr:DUF1127 domain-containing protein [Rhodobacterales bacterium]NCT13359.1 DUF1127 domain-containing protein [Rhodobacterales bacterium]